MLVFMCLNVGLVVCICMHVKSYAAVVGTCDVDVRMVACVLAWALYACCVSCVFDWCVLDCVYMQVCVAACVYVWLNACMRVCVCDACV